MEEIREERSSGECEMLSQELRTVATLCVLGGDWHCILGEGWWVRAANFSSHR